MSDKQQITLGALSMLLTTNSNLKCTCDQSVTQAWQVIEQDGEYAFAGFRYVFYRWEGNCGCNECEPVQLSLSPLINLPEDITVINPRSRNWQQATIVRNDKVVIHKAPYQPLGIDSSYEIEHFNF